MDLGKQLSYLGCVLPQFSLGRSRGSGEPVDQIGVDGVNVRCYRDWPGATGMVEAWDGLASSCADATAFHTPAWQGAIARPYVRVGRWRLITLSVGSRLTGVLPLQVSGTGALESPGEMISDYLDPLIDRPEGECASAWQSILSLLASLPGDAGRSIVLHNVRDDSPCRAALNRIAATARYTLQDEESAVTSRIILPATFDEYLASLGGHDRKELRRKMRNAANKAGARLEIHETTAAVTEDLERIFAQMRAVGGAKGIKAQWMYRPLFKRVAPALLGGRRLCVYTLMLHDAPAAGLICFPTPQGPMMWAGGWDPQHSQLSPGIVLFGMAIQHSIERGYQRFDLLRGHCRYKSELGARDFPIHRLTLSRAA